MRALRTNRASTAGASKTADDARSARRPPGRTYCFGGSGCVVALELDDDSDGLDVEVADDDVSLDDVGGFMPVELELLDGLVVLDSDGLELDGIELEAAELDGLEVEASELDVSELELAVSELELEEGDVASAVRHDVNSVRETAPSPSLSAVAKLDSSPSLLAASVAVTLPSESLSSVSNDAFFAGSPANAANASVVATTPLSTAEIFMVGAPFRAD